MEKLWYGSDEVKDFHPIVEKGLKEALTKSNLEGNYEVLHHFGEHTSGIPDFVIVDKRTKDYILIVEVKKTPLDVFGLDAGDQTRRYVKDLYPQRWKNKFHPYYCVTNLEYIQFYSHRSNTPLIGCALKGSPHLCGRLELEDYYTNFVNNFTTYFQLINALTKPKFSKQLEAISETFGKSMYSLSEILESNIDRFSNYSEGKEKFKRAILYELLRFVFYHYIKSIYKDSNKEYYSNFPEFKLTNQSPREVVKIVEHNFKEAQKIDFKDILSDSVLDESIIPKLILKDKELSGILTHFVTILSDNIEEGIKQEGGIDYFISIIKNKIYNQKEMHKEGKIMSDEALSKVLAEFAISDKDDKIIDPCCGDGNLLISAYDRVKSLSKKTHNEILSQLTGVDKDVNLIQLAAFKLICSNLNQVNKKTKTNLSNTDIFELMEVNKYDSLIMNPPFLRNEEVDINTKKKYLKNLENVMGNPSFINEVSQPNIYFYFMEKAISLLNNDGNAAIILMTKFLNNKDGVYLKKFLLPYLDAIISYPPTFFEGFSVTTCILILKKDTTSKKVSFMKINNNSILSDVVNVRKLISKKEDLSKEDYILLNIDKENLKPEDNWRTYLIDPTSKFSKFESLTFLSELGESFSERIRGKADNCGGSSIIYPLSANNPLKDIVGKIEPKYLGKGLKTNKLNIGRRKMMLTKEDLEIDKGLIVPPNWSNLGSSNNLSGLKKYLESANNLEIKGKTIDLDKIINSSQGSVYSSNIIIPRADRTKHIVYYNPGGNKILLSTNFFSLGSPINLKEDLDIETQIKFMAAFLNSSFGQVQFEIHSNNQEGLRKVEKFIIEKLKVLNVHEFTNEEIKKVVKEFEILNSKNIDTSGREIDSPRNGLDQRIGELIFKKDNLGFKSSNDLTDFFQEFCVELTTDRGNINE